MQHKMKKYLHENNVSVELLSEKTGIDIDYLNSVIDGKTNEITIGNLKKICGALECSIEDIFDLED